ncbi:MAG: hypothetical protein WA210_07500, partial [Burkholderiaceae bacterium]
AHAQRPAPEVVKRRLDALSADIPRRRAWAAEMEAQAREAGGDVDSDAGHWPRFETNPLRALLIGLLIWLLWWLW